MYEDIITKILGEHTQRESEVASLVLSFVSKNPDWEKGETKLYEHRVLDSISRAVEQTFDNPISYYFSKSRERELVDVRCMVYYYLRSLGYTYGKIANLFGRNHATIIWGVKSANNLIEFDKTFRENYKLLKSKIKV